MMFGVDEALVSARPHCGSGTVYQGSHTATLRGFRQRFQRHDPPSRNIVGIETALKEISEGQ
jgi:hypothetical protein